MCGRYVRRSDKQRIAEAFHLGKLPEGFIYSLNSGNPFAFAGFLDARKGSNTNEWLLSAAVITTETVRPLAPEAS